MSHMSDYLQSGLLVHFLRSDTIAKPSEIGIALCRNVPVDTDTGATIPEVANSNNYARVNMGAPADGDWDAIVLNGPGGSGYTANTAQIAFNQATGGDWGWVSGVAILDSATYGAGRMLWGGPLATPREIRENDTFQFPAQSLKIYSH